MKRILVPTDFSEHARYASKVAAQIAHAVKNLGTTPTDCDIIVLGVSTTKFNELTAQHECYIQKDKGLTEVESGTATAAAWIDVP